MGGGASVRSATGAISIAGQGGTTTGAYSFGVWIHTGSIVESTGTATVTIDGVGGNGGGSGENYGVILNGYGQTGATLVRSVNGAIAITALPSRYSR